MIYAVIYGTFAGFVFFASRTEPKKYYYQVNIAAFFIGLFTMSSCVWDMTHLFSMDLVFYLIGAVLMTAVAFSALRPKMPAFLNNASFVVYLHKSRRILAVLLLVCVVFALFFTFMPEAVAL
jgi:hypothetical protein